MGNSFYKKRLNSGQYVSGILNGDRVILSRAITLVESKLHSDNALAEKVLEILLPHTGKSLRIGITGIPGVGKSTFIESFGKLLTSLGKKTAVLTIDPSSPRSGGSILGDKTRMEELANDPLAYIRPSATGDTLGGVNSKTRETILLCEAAGFETIIVETVGVGQSETTVKGMVDFFLLLMLAGAGDELQGIKKGIMEMADTIAITKADGDNMQRSELAKRDYLNALHMFPAGENGWHPKVVTCSSLNKTGIQEIWDTITRYEKSMKSSGYFQHNRQQQNISWMKDAILYYLQTDFYNHATIRKMMDLKMKQVEAGTIPAITAAKEMLDLFYQKPDENAEV